MAHHVELFMSEDWPSEQYSDHERLVDGPWLELFWPVPALPKEMGTITEAQRIEGDPHGCYYAPLSAGFFRSHVNLQCPSADNASSVRLTYKELAALLGNDVIRIYQDADPSPVTSGLSSSTRRYSGVLRVTQIADDPTFPTSLDSRDLPF